MKLKILNIELIIRKYKPRKEYFAKREFRERVLPLIRNMTANKSMKMDKKIREKFPCYLCGALKKSTHAKYCYFGKSFA